jgi:hypothetical protein
MGQKQLNVRLSEDIFDVLEAMAFIEGVSLPDVIRPVIEGLAAEARSEPAIQPRASGPRGEAGGALGKALAHSVARGGQLRCPSGRTLPASGARHLRRPSPRERP